jgi:hypothetical protein
MKNRPYNLIDYIYWRGDLSFAAFPFNDIDNAVFSLLAYCRFEAAAESTFAPPYITIGGALRVLETQNAAFFPQYTVFENKLYRAFLRALSASARFAETRAAFYSSEIDAERELQFAALTFLPQGAPPYIAYRGTDESLTGWKEDFNMALGAEIPAQASARAYLEDTAGKIAGAFLVGGHSKGGNLAVYAAATVSSAAQKRIARVYNNDGPGFTRAFLESEGFCRVKERITALLPQDSIVGLLFERDYPLSIVKSDAALVLQHWLTSWHTAPDSFTAAPSLSGRAVRINKAIMDWIYRMDRETRERFIEALYELLHTARLETLTQVINEWPQNIARIIQSFIKSSDRSKKILVRSIAELISAITDTAPVGTQNASLVEEIKKRLECLHDTLQKQKTN